MNTPPWEIEKIVSKGDYNYVIVRNHPFATKYGYVLEHRVVVENHIGRLLREDEVVHHIDENKKNNHINNLEIKNKIKHVVDHVRQRGKEMCLLKCPSCQDLFVRAKNRTHLIIKRKFTSCSRSCSAKFSRRLQKEGLTDENKKNIIENVQKTFKSFEHHKDP